MSVKKFFRRRIAITNEHGSWVFLLSPLLIGLFAGGNWSLASFYLVIAALSAFLLRHPIIIATKIYSGRRDHRDLPASLFWIGVYGALSLLMVVGLTRLGFGYILILAIPGIPVFLWHLRLVARRAERRQMGVEIVASGVLALTAPAAYWIGVGAPQAPGWILWALTWLQSAASIVYAYLRLRQRTLTIFPDLRTRLVMGKRALLYTSFNLVLGVVLSITGITPPWIFVPYTVQWLETVWGAVKPAIGIKPTRIGLRQLIVSTIFTVLFIIIYSS